MALRDEVPKEFDVVRKEPLTTSLYFDPRAIYKKPPLKGLLPDLKCSEQPIQPEDAEDDAPGIFNNRKRRCYDR